MCAWFNPNAIQNKSRAIIIFLTENWLRKSMSIHIDNIHRLGSCKLNE